ncbi:MAG: hypothetical protein H0W90_09725 [Actinobacteria bacterium]|nr:hypothetical protein [Actinomycetota bacterium]
MATFGAAPAAAWEMQSLAQLRTDVRSEINVVRAQYGLPLLRPSRPLGRAAAQHVYEMAVLGYFGHGSPNRASFAGRLALYYAPRGYASWYVGETLLWWAVPIQAQTIVQLWFRSPSHRRELLAPRFREVGIAAAEVAGAGGVYAGRQVTLVGADFGVRR